ncbi:MAG: hypothetical protein UV45_C0012G0004 [Candidatus Azambacteria bacterium GW2011_GWB1_42_72]|nr:MAG: hypothetical protein UV45_C0012G0004 [Candidatus Azambacteria bacterium GW2011_GWB1_42_72]
MCGPASLKMVLEYFGMEKSEEELGQLTHCGFNALIKDMADFDDIKKYLDQEIPVIVDWFSENDGHYSVAVNMDKENIYLQDPEIGSIRELPLETFKRVWFDFPDKFINSKDDLILRRIIVIQK